MRGLFVSGSPVPILSRYAGATPGAMNKPGRGAGLVSGFTSRARSGARACPQRPLRGPGQQAGGPNGDGQVGIADLVALADSYGANLASGAAPVAAAPKAGPSAPLYGSESP